MILFSLYKVSAVRCSLFVLAVMEQALVYVGMLLVFAFTAALGIATAAFAMNDKRMEIRMAYCAAIGMSVLVIVPDVVWMLTLTFGLDHTRLGRAMKELRTVVTTAGDSQSMREAIAAVETAWASFMTMYVTLIVMAVITLVVYGMRVYSQLRITMRGGGGAPADVAALLRQLTELDADAAAQLSDVIMDVKDDTELVARIMSVVSDLVSACSNEEKQDNSSYQASSHSQSSSSASTSASKSSTSSAAAAAAAAGMGMGLGGVASSLSLPAGAMDMLGKLENALKGDGANNGDGDGEDGTNNGDDDAEGKKPEGDGEGDGDGKDGTTKGDDDAEGKKPEGDGEGDGDGKDGTIKGDDDAEGKKPEGTDAEDDKKDGDQKAEDGPGEGAEKDAAESAAASTQSAAPPEPAVAAEPPPPPPPPPPPQSTQEGGAGLFSSLKTCKSLDTLKKFLSGLRPLSSDPEAARAYITSFHRDIGSVSSSSTLSSPMDKQAAMILAFGFFALVMLALPLLTMTEAFASSPTHDDMMRAQRILTTACTRDMTIRVCAATFVVSISGVVLTA